QRSAWSPARHLNHPRSGAHLGTSPALVRSAKGRIAKTSYCSRCLFVQHIRHLELQSLDTQKGEKHHANEHHPMTKPGNLSFAIAAPCVSDRNLDDFQTQFGGAEHGGRNLIARRYYESPSVCRHGHAAVTCTPRNAAAIELISGNG